MSVHEIIDSYGSSIKQVLDAEKRREVARLLPELSGGLRRLVREAQQGRSDYLLCTLVYDMQANPDGEQAWLQTLELAQELRDTETVLRMAAKQIRPLRFKAAQAVENWENIRSKLTAQLEEFRHGWEQKLSRLGAIAEIPDLLDPEERQQFDHLVTSLRHSLSFNLVGQSQVTTSQYAARWASLVAEFREIEQRLSFETIAETYQFSPHTVAVLKNLTGDEPVALADISPGTLEELHRFRRFCEAVTLRFSARA